MPRSSIDDIFIFGLTLMGAGDPSSFLFPSWGVVQLSIYRLPPGGYCLVDVHVSSSSSSSSSGIISLLTSLRVVVVGRHPLLPVGIVNRRQYQFILSSSSGVILLSIPWTSLYLSLPFRVIVGRPHLSISIVTQFAWPFVGSSFSSLTMPSGRQPYSSEAPLIVRFLSLNLQSARRIAPPRS